MDQFTIQVKLRSNSKAKRNDHKPKKTWAEHFEEAAKIRREAKANGLTRIDVLNRDNDE